jgi:hypothetical protein
MSYVVCLTWTSNGGARQAVVGPFDSQVAATTAGRSYLAVGAAIQAASGEILLVAPGAMLDLRIRPVAAGDLLLAPVAG